MKPRITMRESLADPDLFANILGGDSWFGWRVLLIAAAGEELTDIERAEFKRLTGRDKEPGRLCRELIVAAGRRAGKTEAMLVFGIWIAALCDHRGYLVPGEIGMVLIVSQTQVWSREILTRIEGVLQSSELLAAMIVRRTADAIDLKNGVRIEVRPASYRNLRGPTYIAVIADEIAFWYTSVDYANPDTEILTAVRGGLLTSRAAGGGPLLMASSVYAKTGVLYDYYKRYFGPAGPSDILVAYGTSRDFNPSLPQSEIDLALERDPAANRAEYLSEWRSDVEGFIPRECVEACVGDYLELPPQPGTVYVCFIDSASGVPGGDSYVAVIAHKQGKDHVVMDAIREVRPPFNAFEVINTVLVPLCKAYRVYKVWGDNFAGDLAKDPIRRAGIGYELVEKHKTALYADPFLALLNATKVTLPRHERAVNQICALERSALRSGREQITHPTHGHDDIANAIAGAADRVYGNPTYTLEPFSPGYKDRDLPPPPAREPQAAPRAYWGGNWWQSPAWRKNESDQKIPGVDRSLVDHLTTLDTMLKSGWRP